MKAAGCAGEKDGGSGGVGEALRSVMDGLKPVVGCVQVDFEGGYADAPKVCTWYGIRCVRVRGVCKVA